MYRKFDETHNLSIKLLASYLKHFCSSLTNNINFLVDSVSIQSVFLRQTKRIDFATKPLLKLKTRFKFKISSLSFLLDRYICIGNVFIKKVSANLNEMPA